MLKSSPNSDASSPLATKPIPQRQRGNSSATSLVWAPRRHGGGGVAGRVV